MKLRVQDKIKAISLRMQGFSYGEIMEHIPVSKSTLSGWLRYVKLNSAQEERLTEKVAKRSGLGRALGAQTNRKRRLERQQIAYSEARDTFSRNYNDPLFSVGIALYWAEGSKKNEVFHFMNSDPDLILFMTIWIEKFLGLQRREDISYRLYIHQIYSHEGCEDFWEQYLKIPRSQMKKTVYKPTPHTLKRNPEYKGCIRLELSGIKYYRYMQEWQKLLANKIKIE